MTFEYHLTDDTIELSSIPNLSSFIRNIYYWDAEVNDEMIDEVVVPVRYCIIHP